MNQTDAEATPELRADPAFRTRSVLDQGEGRSLASSLASTAVRLAEAASPAYAFLRRFTAADATVIAEGRGPEDAVRPAEAVKTFVADATVSAVAETAAVAAKSVLSGSYGEVGEESSRRLAALSMFTDEASRDEAARLRAQVRKNSVLRSAATLASGGDNASAAFGVALKACAAEAAAKAHRIRTSTREAGETALIAARILPGALARAAANDLGRLGSAGTAALRIGDAARLLASRATARLEESMKAARNQLASLAKFFTNGANVIMDGVRPIAASPHIKAARGVMIGTALAGLGYMVHMDQDAAIERVESASAQVAVQYKASREAAESFMHEIESKRAAAQAGAEAAPTAIPMPPPRKPYVPHGKSHGKTEYSRTKIVPPSLNPVSTVGRHMAPSAEYLAAATANLAERVGDAGLAKSIIEYQLAWGQTCTSKIRFDGEECRIESEGSVMDFSHGWFASYDKGTDGTPVLAAREFEGQTLVTSKPERTAAAAPRL